MKKYRKETWIFREMAGDEIWEAVYTTLQMPQLILYVRRFMEGKVPFL